MTITIDELRDRTSAVLSYIDHTWEKLTTNAQNGHRDSVFDWKEMAARSIDGHLDDQNHETPYILYLPNEFIYPGGRFKAQFYWDSYFVILSLLRGGRLAMARGMVDNALYLVEKHGLVIPNRKRWAAGSQLPFLSHMVRSVYEAIPDDAWLAKATVVLEKEYQEYWRNPQHEVYRGLSRYHALPWFPQDCIASITMDTEVTWDLSPRFDDKDVLNLLPIDLNCNLLRYETNFAFFHDRLGNSQAVHFWEEQARRRSTTINELMWNEEDGFYYDFDFQRNEQKKVKSLASYFAMYDGVANVNHARRLVCNLSHFETQYGLTTCDFDYGYEERQWNYPVGWAPLHWIVYKALRSYGYESAARVIAIKWISMNLDVWNSTGAFYEKYDVVKGSHEVIIDRRYTNQVGFGWTNAVFHLLVDQLIQ